MTGISRLLAALVALCLASCTGDTETATSGKPADWTFQCSPHDEYFAFDAGWSDKHWLSREAYTASLSLTIYKQAFFAFIAGDGEFRETSIRVDDKLISEFKVRHKDGK